MSATLYPGESYPGDYYSESDPQNTIFVPFVASATVVRAPTLAAAGSATLTVPFVSATTTLHAPALGHFNSDIILPFITATTSVYAPARLLRSGVGPQPHGISIALNDPALEPRPTWTRLDHT